MGVVRSLERFSALAAAQNQAERAARLFGAAAGLRESMGMPLSPSEQKDQNRDVEAIRAVLGEEAFAAAWLQGRAMKQEQAVRYALEE
jgi:hypothetical protein